MTDQFLHLSQASITNAVGWTLIHFLWQGVVIGVAFAVLRVTFQQASSQSRYATSCGTMMAIALVPLATFVYETAGSLGESTEEPALVITAQPLPAQPWAYGNAESLRSQDIDVPIEESQATAVAASASPTTESFGPPPSVIVEPKAVSVSERLQSFLPWVVTLWALGVIGLGIRMGLGLVRVRRWRKSACSLDDTKLLDRFTQLAQRVGIGRVIQLRVSMHAAVPAVIGWFKPVILLPASMVSGLTPTELDSILAHELAHVRRHDYIVNLCQMLVEICLFYHPVVWWVSRAIRQDRELCCDDFAAEVCGDRIVLASALARMEEIRCREERIVLAANGGSLVARVKRLLANDVPRITWWPSIMVALIGMTLLLAGVGASLVMAEPSPTLPAISQDPHTTSAVSPFAQAERTSEDGHSPLVTRRSEVMKVDSKTGEQRRVFTDIRLSNKSDRDRNRSVDLVYSNVLMYSFIPERAAKELRAIELGTIDFGAEAPRKPLAFQSAGELEPTKLFEADVEVQAESGENDEPEEFTVAELTEPLGDGKVVPYDHDVIWVPGHLGSYGLNKTKQHRFKIVRIDRVDLGIGRDFGPVNALVLNDDNSDFGVLGRDWAQQVRGDGEETLWFLSDGTFVLQAPRSKEPSAAPPQSIALPDVAPPGENQPGQLAVSAEGQEASDPRSARPEIKSLATHDYSRSTRKSTGWIEVDGVNVPVDVGIEHESVVVSMTLFFDVVAVDRVTKKVLWKLDWHKTEPIWQTLSIVELPSEDGPQLAVELFSADPRERSLNYRYLSLRDGEEVEYEQTASVPSSTAGPARDMPKLIVVESTGAVIRRATLSSLAFDPKTNSGISNLEVDPEKSEDGPRRYEASVTRTLVSAVPRYLIGDKLEAGRVEFNLPSGSGARVEFSGDQIEITRDADRTRVVVTEGNVSLLDENGVVRATATADGGAEQLVIECRRKQDDISMTLQSKRLVADPDYPDPPLHVDLNDDRETGVNLQDRSKPGVRYWYSPPNEDSDTRFEFKMQRTVARASSEVEGMTESPLVTYRTDSRLDLTPDDQDTLLEAVDQLGDWSEDQGRRFDSRGYLRVAEAIAKMPIDQRVRFLRTLGEKRHQGQLIVLCRMLFMAREGREFRRPYLGAPVFAGSDVKDADFPLEPITLIEGVPLLIVQGYALAGRPESASSYLAYCLNNCDWAARNFDVSDDQILKAYQGLSKADFWGPSLDVREWGQLAELQNQIQPTIQIRVGPHPWINEVRPLYMLNGSERIQPKTLAKELAKREIPKDAQIYVLVDSDSRFGWVESLINALQEAEYKRLTFVDWQQPKQGAPKAGGGEDESEDEDDELAGWGPKPLASDLRLKLTLALDDAERRAGDPIRARLEIKNFGQEPTGFDPQYYAAFRVVKVKHKDGKPDLYIGPTPQTSGQNIKLKPGESYRIWDDVDITELFMLDQGEYTVQVAEPKYSDGALPQSNVHVVKVARGNLPPRKRFAKQLSQVLPERWELSLAFGSVYLSHVPTNLKRDVTTVRLFFPTAKELETLSKRPDSNKRLAKIGETELGTLYVREDSRANEIWPDHIEAISSVAATAIPAPLDEREQDDAPRVERKPNRPWRVTGTVKDAKGHPMEAVEVVAYAGVGSLRRTGKTVTDKQGKYQLDFGPGFYSENKSAIQAATIYAMKPGYFDENLGRQGDLLAALEAPDEVNWGDKTLEDVVLPDTPKEVNFVLKPATKLKGTLRGEDGKPAVNFSVSLTGSELPPSSSVIAQVRTNEAGEFEIPDIPTGYDFQLLVEPSEKGSPWLAWASPSMVFVAGKDSKTTLKLGQERDEKTIQFTDLDVRLLGTGTNWKQSLKDSASQTLELKWQGLETDESILADRIWIELGNGK